MLCSGRLKLVSIDTCYLSADSREDLIKCKDADGGEPNNPLYSITSIPYIRSFYCCHVQSPSFVPPLVMMLPFSSVALSLFSRPRCLVKINYSFPFTLFNCLATRLGLSQIRHSNIEIFVITGLLSLSEREDNSVQGSRRDDGSTEREI